MISATVAEVPLVDVVADMVDLWWRRSNDSIRLYEFVLGLCSAQLVD